MLTSLRLNALVATAVSLGALQAQAQDAIAHPPATERAVEVMLLSINMEAIHVIVNGTEVETIPFAPYKEARTADPNIRQFPLLSSVLQRLFDDGWRMDDSATTGVIPLLFVLTREVKK